VSKVHSYKKIESKVVVGVDNTCPYQTRRYYDYYDEYIAKCDHRITTRVKPKKSTVTCKKCKVK
jgi:hypothetical protein